MADLPEGSQALKPCPFCGVHLAPNTNQADLYVRRYGTHYNHPKDQCCWLSDDEVSPANLETWNRRAASPAPGPLTDAEMPPLPETQYRNCDADGVLIQTFTGEQMRAFARAILSAQAAKGRT